MQVKSPRNATKRLETWRVLERFYRSGRARAIGVSNYEQRHLQELLDCATVKPMVNQVSSGLWDPCMRFDRGVVMPMIYQISARIWMHAR